MKRSKYDFDSFIDRNFFEIASIYVDEEKVDTDQLIEENSNYLDEYDKDRLPEDILEDNAMSDIVFCWAEDNEMEVKRQWSLGELQYREKDVKTEKQMHNLKDDELFLEDIFDLDFDEDEARVEKIWRKLVKKELVEVED